MDSNGKNDLCQNDAAGVIQQSPGAEGGEYLNFEAEEKEKEKAEAEEQESARRQKRKRLTKVIFVLSVLAAAGVALWMVSNDRRTHIRVPVREPARKSDQTNARSNDDGGLTAATINEIRNAIGTPTPAPFGSPVPPTGVKGATVTSTTPVTIAMDGIGSVRPSATETTTGQSGASSDAAAAARREERNPERSIRCAPTPTPFPARQQIAGGIANQPSAEPALLKRGLNPSVALPPFGAFLPVRTLGAIYTLRQSQARFELTRDVRGDGWELKKGTLLIGQLQGSEQDRAYISMTGFVDPVSGKLVKLSGDLLGADGAPGLKGKSHKVSSTWKRILDRAVTSGVSLGQAALTRGNSTTVVLPGAVAPELTSLTSTSRREFVEVPAASPAYVLITRLPEQAQGVDSPQIAAGAGERSTFSSNNNADRALSDEEVAGLLESGSPEAIRKAIPRMSPELRRIAEMALKEADK
jgi:hypothetical protein